MLKIFVPEFFLKTQIILSSHKKILSESTKSCLHTTCFKTNKTSQSASQSLKVLKLLKLHNIRLSDVLRESKNNNFISLIKSLFLFETGYINCCYMLGGDLKY